MKIENAVVEAVSSKPVTTKFGNRDTYSFKAGGVWIKTGFKDSGVQAGDVVTFDYVTGKYGNELTGAVSKSTAAPAATAAVLQMPKAPTSGYSNKGTFPIPPLDGQRSIVRQNALTNAREMIVDIILGAEKKSSSVATWADRQAQFDSLAAEIERIARKFEAYTTGDVDLAAVKESIEQEQKAA